MAAAAARKQAPWLSWVQCTRTSPCAHARHMARRLTLLALLACAVAVHRPPYTSDVSESESLDPFYLWDDDSNEVTPISNFRTTKTSAKVMLKLNKQPKVNVTMKNSKSDKKKEKDFSKTSSININSNTNFVFTKRPTVKKTHPVPVIHNEQHMEPEYDYDYAEENMIPVPKPTTTTRRPEATRPRRRIHSTTRRPTTTRARTTTFRKITKKPQTKKVICPTKTPIWLSNYFHDEKNKKSANKKPQKSGLISNIYNWISKTSIFGATNWFQSINYRVTTTTTTTTTTEAPVTENDWFQNLLVTEEADESSNNAPVVVKKPEKKLKRSYNGYQLIRAYSDSQWKVHELLELQEDSQGSGITWWTMPSLNGSSDILIPPDLLSDVKDTLKSAGIDFDVVIWDLQKAIKYENPQLSKKQRLELVQLRGHPMTWKRYHRYFDILRYLEYLQHSYGDIVELVPLGRSSEGLPLVVVKVSLPTNESYYEGASPKSNKKKWKLRSRLKPTVWLDGGTHAREWIAPAVATWILSAIVEGENGSGSEYDLLKQADFYIMPILNPDGYEYSHTQDRLWMKTRSRPDDQSDDFFMGWLPWNWGRKECIGVDADRNWDYHWGEKDSSRDPCADKYAGPHPFSEPETRAVSQFLAEHRGQIKVYITLHAYSQAWLLPSSYADMPFADDGMLMEMGKLATTALKDLYGTKYQIGTMEELRQPAAGMSHDWAKARAGIKFSYHVDLRDSSGPYGFLLPGSQIISTSRETWQAIKAIVDNLNPN